ncbi:hypothetical protein H4R34_006069, partial [Dimargaris verticillata]
MVTKDSLDITQAEPKACPKPLGGLQWQNLTYRIASERRGLRRKPTQFKTVLHNVSGSVMPGEMVAILGSSGAGKSSLLNALAGRLSTGTLQGQITFDGQQRNPGRFKKQAVYVEQTDLMYAQFTVRETLRYAAALRLPSAEYTPAQKEARVNQVIQWLRLESAADTRVGDSYVRGVSGGERKRTSIGVELVTDPRLMFLDEATSGLDSNSALHVCQVVKDVALE